MNRQQIKSCQKIFFWLAAELLLNFCGLDTLADYSEYLDQVHCFEVTEKRRTK